MHQHQCTGCDCPPQETVDMTDRKLETSFGRMRLGLGVAARKLEEVVVGRKGVDRMVSNFK